MSGSAELTVLCANYDITEASGKISPFSANHSNPRRIVDIQCME
jgi:hypothetical protein